MDALAFDGREVLEDVPGRRPEVRLRPLPCAMRRVAGRLAEVAAAVEELFSSDAPGV